MPNRPRALIEEQGRRCIAIAGDIGDEAFCRDAVARTVAAFGRLDLLVNNAGRAASAGPARGHRHARRWSARFAPTSSRCSMSPRRRSPTCGAGAAIINTHLGDRLSRQPPSDRLRRDQGRDRRVHALARREPQGAQDPGQRGRAGPGLDAADPGVVSGRPRRAVRGGAPSSGDRPSRTRSRRAISFSLRTRRSCMTGQVLHPNGGEIVGG